MGYKYHVGSADSRIVRLILIVDEVEAANRKVRLLDGIVRSKYYGNPGKLAAWASASHAEAAPKKKKKHQYHQHRNSTSATPQEEGRTRDPFSLQS